MFDGIGIPLLSGAEPGGLAKYEAAWLAERERLYDYRNLEESWHIWEIPWVSKISRKMDD